MDEKEKITKKRMKIVLDEGKGPTPIIDEEICCDGEAGGKEIEKIIAISSRGNVAMTRLNNEDLMIIDALVNLEVYDSRSEAIAYFTHIGLKQKKDMISKVMPYVEQIKKLKEKARSSLDK
jgi:hypothetical protein